MILERNKIASAAVPSAMEETRNVPVTNPGIMSSSSHGTKNVEMHRRPKVALRRLRVVAGSALSFVCVLLLTSGLFSHR